MLKKGLFLILVFLFLSISIYGQTHISVPLGHPVYLALEQAQMRGLCDPLPAVKPYSRSQILLIIDEILEHESGRFNRLSDAERLILEQIKTDFSPEREGWDLSRGTVSVEKNSDGVYLSGEFGMELEMVYAGGYYPLAGGYKEDGASHPESEDFYSDIILLPSIYFIGDLGKNLTYGLTLFGFFGKSPRALLGTYNNYWGPYDRTNNEHRLITVHSEPLAYFPYTYKKRWDGFLFAPEGLSSGGQLAWPVDYSLGYATIPELSGEFFNGHLSFRIARLDREWAGMTTNGSLILNQKAQPFLAFETVINPFSWISISSLTGVLEYHNAVGNTNRAEVKRASESFQNAFSIVMLELNIKRYFNFGLGSSAVWPKRFELGYLFPLTENFLYQNNVGDFDNLALFLNMQGQYPGIGKLWLSLYLDEVNLDEIKRFFELDRMMYAFQVGGSVNIPWLPFSSITFSYTKNEPYNYSHNRIKTPWNGDKLMEQNYINFGSSLGHYIPPNSDEFLVRFETMPLPRGMFSFQYQMIRHGADYGDRSVDGSSLWSELDPVDRSEKKALEKYFLQDGAYQWMHIIKLRGEYSFKGFKVPVSLFAEIGGVYSYFTDIEGETNSGTPEPYRIINTPQYPHSLYFIGLIGARIFPKF